MQEAYRPLRSKCSLCWSAWGGVPNLRSRGGTLSQVQGGTPSQIQGGYPIPGQGGTPSQGGYPIPGLGGTPSQVWGVPHLRSGGYPIPGGTPSKVRLGTPSQVGGYPIPGPGGWGGPHPMSRPEMGYPPDLRWGTPPPASVNRLKILPSPILRVAGGKKVKYSFKVLMIEFWYLGKI